MKNTNFKMIVKNKLKENGITLNQLASQADLSEDTLRSSIYGKSRDIKLSTLLKIANVLHCSLDELAGRSFYNADDLSLLYRFHRLSFRSRRTLECILDMEENTSLHASDKAMNIIPVIIPYGNTMDGFLYNESHFGQHDISDYPVTLREDVSFGLKISSSLYEPVYYYGDTLLFSCSKSPELFDTCLFMDTAGRIYIRRISPLGLEPVAPFGKRIPLTQVPDYKAIGCFLRIAKELQKG